MKSMVIEVNRIEEEGDSLYQTAISDLFKNEKDVIEVIKWKSLYGCLETCLDSAESVANEIESIIMKMSQIKKLVKKIVMGKIHNMEESILCILKFLNLQFIYF